MVGKRYWIVLLGIRTDTVSLVYVLHVAISPVDCWFWFCSFVFLLGTLRYAVPDAWRLWAGPRLAYCCG